MPRRAARIFFGATSLLLLAQAVGGCVDVLEPCAGKSVSAGQMLDCPMPGWTDRSYTLELPQSWDGTSPLPVVIAIHGGGGNKQSAAKVTCSGDTGGAACFSQVAMQAGMAVLRPDGTGTRPLRNVRTWNAGGGTGDWNCASGGACKAGVDDVRYFRELLDDVAKVIPVDSKRIYATGLSNGGAMSHRLACQLSDRIAAIVPVGGANQFAAAGGSCPTPVPILHIHGTQDPCWTYKPSSVSCVEGSDAGVKQGAEESMEYWRAVNGCTADTIEAALPDAAPSDGTRSYRVVWQGCAVATELIRVEGGGHTWPGGNPYLSEDRIGRVPRDFGSQVLVDFLRQHALP